MTNTTPPPVSPDAVQTLVDHAAVQSDRWLFIALLVVVFAGFVVAIKWMASQNLKSFATYREDMNAMRAEVKTLHEDRIKIVERYAAELREIVNQQTKDAREMLREHGAILAKNAETMGSVNQALRELQSSCAISRAALGFPRHGAAGAGALPSTSS